MLTTLAKLSRFGFNQHSLTLEDFNTICQTERIAVVYEDVDSSFYMEVTLNTEKRKFIVISKRLTAFETIFTAFHELGHALLGTPSPARACFFGLDDTPEEQMANDFATIALMPLRSVCNTQAFIESNEVSSLTERMHRRRLWLFEHYGI